MPMHKLFHWGAMASLGALILLCLLWETVLAPLHPGGSWMVLKAVPLLIPLYGVIRRDVYTLQWSAMMILMYFAEGVVRGYSDTGTLSAWLGWSEVALVLVYFLCSILYLRPYKQAAKRLAKELLDKVKMAK